MPSLDELIDKATTPGDGQLMHGVLLHAIDGKGTDLYKRAAGTSALAPTSPPINPTTHLLRLASCTKLATTIAALQCVERGLLALDEPLDALLPELCALPVVTSAPDPASAAAAPPRLTYAPRRNPLTLRALLTHTSGVGYEMLSPVLRAWRASQGEGAAAAPAELAAKGVVGGMSAPLVFEPGEGWAYGGGVDWAGLAVERAVNDERRRKGEEGEEWDLEDWMRKEMFGKVGMGETSFRLGEKRGRLVEMVLKDGGGPMFGASGVKGLSVATGPMVGLPDPPAACMGGGGLYSSVPDFVALLSDLIAPEPRLLRKETVDAMFKPQLEKGGKAHKMLDGQPHMYALMTGGAPAEGTEVNFGIGGLLIMSDLDGWGARTRGTLSWGGNGNLVWFANRKACGGDGIAAFFATQVIPPGDADIQVVVKEFFQEVWRRAG